MLDVNPHVRAGDGVGTILGLERLEPLLFRGRPHAGGSVRLYGGEVAAQAMTAAASTVPAGRDLHSLHAHFLSPGDSAVQVVYKVGAARDGGSFSARTVEARQAGKAILVATASFQVPETGLSHQVPVLNAPGPEDLPEVHEALVDEPRSLAWANAVMARLSVDFRFPEGVRRGRDGGHPAGLRVWVRTRTALPEDALAQVGGLVYLSDLLMLSAGLQPHPHQVDDDDMQIATLSHAINVHSRCRADDWLLYELESDWAGGGRCLTRGRMFDRDGLLCASTTQEGLIRAKDWGRHE